MSEMLKKHLILDRKIETIMQVRVDSTPIGEVLTAINQKISDSDRFYIVTPNPELVLMAQDNLKLRNALNDADISIPDGIGLSMAVKFLKLKAPKLFLPRLLTTFVQGVWVGLSVFVNRKWLLRDLVPIKGRDLFIELIKLAESKRWKVFLLGGQGSEAEGAAQKLLQKYRKLKTKTFGGPMLSANLKPVTKVDIKLQLDAIRTINQYRPHLLFVAMNNPKQEIWIHENISKLNINGAMTVGGTFRYIAGMSKLPPKLLVDIGLEWLWRLITEPVRVKRIFHAWPVFPIKIWMKKLQQKNV